MNYIAFITNLLISIGAIVMALNIKKFRDMMLQLKNLSQLQYDHLRPLLIFHHLLISAFFIGYLIVLYTVNTTEITIGNLFVSVIFFSGAVFVLLGIILQKRMIASIGTAYQDTVIINHKLTINQEELTQTNISLKQEIKEHKTTGITLQRSHDTQTIVNKLLKESLTDSTVMDVVNLCLDLVLSLPWLSFDSKGCIYLVEDKSDELIMKAHRGFSDDLQKTCDTIPFGKCLCGRAAAEQKTIYASHIDDRHEILISGEPGHGHYCLPIQAKGRTLGIINIYVEVGHERNDWEEDFLKAVANTMAIILMQHDSEAQNKEMERRLYQSQKMESIGTLAGGIAHDFNNILSGILGYAQLAARNLDDSDKVKNNLSQINKGAKRASDLIQQILTFSRQGKHTKVPVKLYIIVKEVIKFLRSSMPSTISINESILSQATVKADQTQVHQIVMNLCTNAFHAMRETGGQLSVSLSEADIKDKYDVPELIINPGRYLKLQVSDSGYGIASKNLSKIFEPYFTTKKIGEGTGLGLAVVLGIVEEHNGYLKVNSKLGAGSVFQVYFPIIEEKLELNSVHTKETHPQRGTEHLLIVDDEESILTSISEFLEDFGYSVSPFLDPESAFQEFQKNPDKFDLIMTDMTMPNLSGDELTLKILKLRKEMPIILCSGYSDKISKNRAIKMGIKKYLQKPIDMQALLFLIRKILDKN